MNKIDELKKKAKAKKRKEKQILLEGAKNVEVLVDGIKELIAVIQKDGLDYKEALKVISKESKDSLNKGNYNLSKALNQIRKSLPKTIQKVNINNPGVLPQIDYKKLNSIADEIVKNFILSQDQVANSWTLARDNNNRVKRIVSQYDQFTITTIFNRNSDGKITGGNTKKTNKRV